MSTDYIKTTEYELRKLNALRDRTAARLADLEEYSGYRLIPSSGRKKKYYYSAKKGSSEKVYLGGDEAGEVRKMREYRFLTQLHHDLETEIGLLTALHEKHVDLDFETINLKLPEIYRDPGMKLPPFADTEHAAVEWKAKMEAEKAKYPIKYPEKLKMTALDGTQMRSKSELIIANLLIANSIPYVYELPHVINGIEIYTDFTILSTMDYKTEVMIEHEGMMDMDFYQEQFLDKVKGYLAAGIIPGRDIYFTFDDLHGGFDPSPVQDIIDTRLIRR